MRYYIKEKTMTNDKIEYELKGLYEHLHLDEDVYDYCSKIEKSLKERFEAIDQVAEYNQLKVIHAMQKNRVSERHFAGTTGYGYDDDGRDTLRSICRYFSYRGCPCAPAHYLWYPCINRLLYSGNLRPGDELLSPVGKPYDTLEGVIGIRPEVGSLAEYGVTYRQVELLEDGSFDYPAIEKAINEKTKLVTIQRSKGYLPRPTFSVQQIGELISFVKKIKPDVICMVDNCYGEFVETY